jgi:hypothetical protein
MLSGEAANYNFIVFGLTRPGFEPTIYRTEPSTLATAPLMSFSGPSGWSYSSWIYNYLTVQSVPITTKFVSANPVHGVYSIKHYVIKFVSGLRQIGGFLLVLRFSSTNKTDRHDITKIILKVSLNTIRLTHISQLVHSLLKLPFNFQQTIQSIKLISFSSYILMECIYNRTVL